jgi:hypothetical protein
LDPRSKKKSISGAVRLREGSEACSEGVTGLVEAAEPATGSTLAGEIGRCTSSSAECSSKGVKSNSSPEPASSRKLTGAALRPAVRGGAGCCVGFLLLPQAITETGRFTGIEILFGILYRTIAPHMPLARVSIVINVTVNSIECLIY